MFPKVYYINLESRVDRRQHIETEIEKIGLEGIRICAVPWAGDGYIGCSRSHIKAVEAFIKSNEEFGIIVEDDATFLCTQDVFQKTIHEIMKEPNWDVVMFSYRSMKDEQSTIPNLLQIRCSYLADAYLLRRDYAYTLLENFKEGEYKLEGFLYQHKMKNEDFCLDIYWRHLQLKEDSRWFGTNPILAYQYPSYSDITDSFRVGIYQ